eukprot:scaffold3068_cov401-Prasinococcus_capsulatus_cf.AAC.15
MQIQFVSLSGGKRVVGFSLNPLLSVLMLQSGGAPLKSFIENEARRRSWRQCQHRCIERQCTISSSVTTREECDYCVNRDMIKLDDLKDVKRCLRSKLLAEVLSIAVIRNPLERAIAEYCTFRLGP